MSCRLIKHLNERPDPGMRDRINYPLVEIVFLCISSIISGFNGWEAIEDFDHSKLDWLRKSLSYENSIPHHDSVARAYLLVAPCVRIVVTPNIN